MKANEIMTPDPDVLTPDDSLTRAAQLMRDLDVGIVPVVNDQSEKRLEGVITDRDITVRHVAEGHSDTCSISDHMTKDRIDTVRPDTDVDEIMDVMRRDQVRRVPIVDDNGRVVGIVAQADIAVKEGPEEPDKVEQTVEKISQPGHPRPRA